MDLHKYYRQRITHELDMDLLRELGERLKLTLTKEIDLAEKNLITKWTV
jgi:hypothetical protein